MSTANGNDEEFDIPETLVDGLLRKHGWSEEFTNRALDGYLQFMKLKVQLEDWDATQLSPSSTVDKVWHRHMLYPAHYAKACQDYTGGHFIDHNPDGGLDAAARTRRLQNTQIGLRVLFGRNDVDTEIGA